MNIIFCLPNLIDILTVMMISSPIDVNFEFMYLAKSVGRLITLLYLADFFFYQMTNAENIISLVY